MKLFLLLLVLFLLKELTYSLNLPRGEEYSFIIILINKLLKQILISDCTPFLKCNYLFKAFNLRVKKSVLSYKRLKPLEKFLIKRILFLSLR